ncbi:toll/interleukin-1 receptor domain-containing protein [Cupriavidus consociatus]|uniref:toll/interleukin-1 receptor domain-containing protein n=1 Tax=Cupriavidus consociatus TaxID=2821357 RepID=UPI001AE3DDE3|nr:MULTISPECIES: toll/interleukin-1 receptor domain-containing protein [unclassified Cupriavidus]MBP0622872.1 toll/interleukin-1 receptor domain-containing protein [Cupriavidus sp. LEh25]MDK2659559.1 toll/interleukin-1 receptor domain-containing protein [Cupriavidus sp. LEh21]
MAIDQWELRSAASRRAATRTYATSGYGKKKGFLCHSHQDRDLALGLQQTLKEDGLELYIDWQDSEMPSAPNRDTASRIQRAIREANVFLFLATQASMASRWCPWEIGYADGVMVPNQIAIVPTRDGYGNFHGNEYLQLYRRIDRISPGAPLSWFTAGGSYPFGISTF